MISLLRPSPLHSQRVEPAPPAPSHSANRRPRRCSSCMPSRWTWMMSQTSPPCMSSMTPFRSCASIAIVRCSSTLALGLSQRSPPWAPPPLSSSRSSRQAFEMPEARTTRAVEVLPRAMARAGPRFGLGCSPAFKVWGWAAAGPFLAFVRRQPRKCLLPRTRALRGSRRATCVR